MLISAQAAVKRFHEIMGAEIGLTPSFRGAEIDQMRWSLIREEAQETLEAIQAGDFPEAVDGLVDLI